MGFYSKNSGLLGTGSVNPTGVHDIVASNLGASKKEMLKSKNLTGTQGFTMSVSTPTKDMQTLTARQVPSGYNPSSGALTPSGSRYAWSDWGGDWFDSWGDFYIYNPNPLNNTASYISFATINGADGTIYTETQTHHGKTFEIKHGWVTTGIFKLDVACTSDETFEFCVGAYGNMGSDSNTQNFDFTYSASWGTLHYNRNTQSTSGEIFFTHIIPKLKEVNDAVVKDTTHLFTNVYGNDNLAMWTGPMTHGSTWYFIKSSNANTPTGANVDWIENDIEITKGDYY